MHDSSIIPSYEAYIDILVQKKGIYGDMCMLYISSKMHFFLVIKFGF